MREKTSDGIFFPGMYNEEKKNEKAIDLAFCLNVFANKMKIFHFSKAIMVIKLILN